jgi:hypothetical protein
VYEEKRKRTVRRGKEKIIKNQGIKWRVLGSLSQFLEVVFDSCKYFPFPAFCFLHSFFVCCCWLVVGCCWLVVVLACFFSCIVACGSVVPQIHCTDCVQYAGVSHSWSSGVVPVRCVWLPTDVHGKGHPMLTRGTVAPPCTRISSAQQPTSDNNLCFVYLALRCITAAKECIVGKPHRNRQDVVFVVCNTCLACTYHSRAA